MHKTTFFKHVVFTIVSVLFVLQLNAQIVISKPNLGFTQACASENFNSYNVTFVFSPSSALESSNQFILELSDADGNFDNSTIVYTSNAGEIVASPATISFSLPSTTAGENYKLKVKSTAPVASSSPSDVFAAYYKLHDTPFTINNLVPIGVFCSNGSYILTIDNPGSLTNESPLNYPSLTYNWFKETSPTTSVFISQGNTLTVTEEGTYFVETNYGSCTSNSYSNRVEIIEASNGDTTASISSSLGNPFCPEQEDTILSAISGISYQWFKDGIEIEGATNQMYSTNQSGEYSVDVDLGECHAFASIDLIAEGFSSSINITENINIEEDETLTVIVTDDAISPVYKWYKNDSLIQNATQPNLEIMDAGNYRVVISETVGCLVSKEYLFTVTEQFPNVASIPNVISPNGDGINDTWIIPPQYVSGSNTEVLIYSSQGKLVFKTNDYFNDWPQTQPSLSVVNQVYYYIITPINGKSLKGSITLIK